MNHDVLSSLHQGAILNEYHMWKKCHKMLQWDFYGLNIYEDQFAYGIKQRMFWYKIDFEFTPTDDYEFQHFEPIEYVNNVPWFSLSLQQNDHKINIKFDQFSNHSQSMTQQSCISFSQKN